MKFYNYIKEARRNPELNPKTSIVEYLHPHKNRQDCFIQFSDINKLGINPKSLFNTPLGIYSYPLRQVWHLIENNSIPFAGKRKYCILFACSDPMLIECDEYNEFMLKNDINFYKREIFEKYNVRYNFDDFYIEVKNGAWSGHPFHIFWNFTRKTSDLMTKYPSLFKKSIRPLVVWNDLLRMRDYVGFTDRKGKGYIHPNEPTQAVFLSKEKLKLIDSIPNKRYERTAKNERKIQYFDDLLENILDGSLPDIITMNMTQDIKNGYLVEYSNPVYDTLLKFAPKTNFELFLVDMIDWANKFRIKDDNKFKTFMDILVDILINLSSQHLISNIQCTSVFRHVFLTFIKKYHKQSMKFYFNYQKNINKLCGSKNKEGLFKEFMEPLVDKELNK